MKGICFKEPLFMATIEGKKKQTRRIINPQPTGSYHGFIEFTKKNIKRALRKFDFTCALSAAPRYQVGDIVYLKEPYRYYESTVRRVVDLQYKFRGYCEFNDDGDEIMGWANKLFMPESAARYFIKITGVRVERLQDISDEDCIKEGIQKMHVLPLREYLSQNYIGFGERQYYSNGDGEEYDDAHLAYAALIDKINGRGTWDSNPYVWVYDYELTEKR